MSKIDKAQVEKLKGAVNKKVLLGGMAILMCLALIVVCSFSTFIIDPSGWQTTEFLTDELIICAIVVMSMVSVMLMGQSSNASSPLSRIAKARVAFFATLKMVESKNVNSFRQWVRKVLQPEDIKTIKNRRLRHLGIDDVLILELDDVQLKALTESAQKFPIETADSESDKKGRFFKKITKEQYEGILKIKRTEFKLKFVEPEYYLSVKNLTDTRTVSERSLSEGKKKGMFIVTKVVTRLILTVVSAMIFASLVRDVASDMDAAAAWAKFISRLWAMISSAFMGYTVGVQINDIDAEYVEMRTQVHNRYLQDGAFKPMTEQEEAREEFIKSVAEQQVMRLESKSEIE